MDFKINEPVMQSDHEFHEVLDSFFGTEVIVYTEIITSEGEARCVLVNQGKLYSVFEETKQILEVMDLDDPKGNIATFKRNDINQITPMWESPGHEDYYPNHIVVSIRMN